MYEMIKYVLAIMMLGLGLFMIICPKLATKKELRDDPNMVAKNRKSGIVITICGII